MKTPKLSENKIVLYTDKCGNVELRADIEKDTLWATQKQIAQLFDVNSQAITKHLGNIFNTGELNKNSVCSKMEHTGSDGKIYKVAFYNLDAIIAVGYRVNSKKATQFRIWASSILRDYLVNGYAVAEHKLSKSPEGLEGLREAINLIESKQLKGKLKGKITLRITKNLVP